MGTRAVRDEHHTNSPLGASFAQFEMAVVLRELVKRRHARPADPAPERPFRRAITETPRRDAEVILS
jgi:cytochrome P450